MSGSSCGAWAFPARFALASQLMENQVATLRAKGVACDFLSSTRTVAETAALHHELDAGRLKLLYATPELIATTRFAAIYSRNRLLSASMGTRVHVRQRALGASRELHRRYSVQSGHVLHVLV